MNDPAVAPFQSLAVPLGDAFDLLAAYRPPLGFFFERRGSGVAGMEGSSFTLPGTTPSGSAGIVHALRSHVRFTGDAAPIAAGVYRFRGEGDLSSGLMIPRTAARREGGRTWRLDIYERDDDAARTPPWEPVIGGTAHDSFTEMQLREVPRGSTYEDAVDVAIDRIRGGAMRKVVLARTIEVEAGRTLDPRLLAGRLRAVDPEAYTFAAPTEDGVLVGASPELLVSRRGREVRSNPLAGSAPRSGDPEEDRANADTLITSAKEREEHAIVVDAVAETVRPFCEKLTWDPEPVLRETPNVWHLSTRFHGVLREPSPTALDLVAALHPTPAVAGAPREAALDAIAELEPFDRGRYAGPVGWVDAEGDGEWAIALRCAELRGDRAILYAGAGIVAGSVAARELDETERKFRAFIDALRWG
jgi:isochorismate synthase